MKALREILARVSSEDLVLRLSALVALIYGTQSEVLEALFVVLAGVGLLAPALLRRPLFWLTLLGTSVLIHGMKWFEIDNHKVLFAYWMFTLALGLKGAHLGRSLGQGARLLIAACFGCGVFWKIYGGQFTDGSFLHLSFLLNGKFEPFTQAFSGLTLDQLAHAKASAALFHAGVLNMDALVLPTTERLGTMALVASYFTIAIEAAIALTFLLAGRAPHWLRHGLLLTFIVLVYPIATVPGFACILITMGLADLGDQKGPLRELYLLAFAFSALSFIPKYLSVYMGVFFDFLSW